MSRCHCEEALGADEAISNVQIEGMMKIKMGTSASMRRTSKNFTRRSIRPGGAVINVISAVIFFGLLGLGVWWVVKQWGQASEQYTGAMIDARNDAWSVNCQMNMRTIGQNIQMFAISNEGLPESLAELRRWSGNSDLFRCPAPDGAEYVYIPGQTSEMSASNILVFEPNAVHDGCASVLLLGGTVGFLTPDQLDQALARIKAELQARPR